MQEIQEKILGYIEKNSRIDLKDLRHPRRRSGSGNERT